MRCFASVATVPDLAFAFEMENTERVIRVPRIGIIRKIDIRGISEGWRRRPKSTISINFFNALQSEIRKDSLREKIRVEDTLLSRGKRENHKLSVNRKLARLWLTRTIDRSPRRAVNRPFRFTFCELKFRVPNTRGTQNERKKYVPTGRKRVMEKSCLTSTSGERPRTPRIEFHVTKPMRSYYITRTTRVYIHRILINYILSYRFVYK